MVPVTVKAAFIPHSFATPSLVAFVGYQKYQMGVPNYRLEKHFERKGIMIPDPRCAVGSYG